jgi:hypothetical protein
MVKRKLTRKHKQAISTALKRYHKKCRLCTHKKENRMTSKRKSEINKRIREIAENQRKRRARK